MKQRLTFLWIFAGLILAVGATLSALPDGSSTATAQAISTESPVSDQSADPSTQAAIVRADPDPQCGYPDICPPPPPADCVFELVSSSTVFDQSLKTTFQFRVSGCDSQDVAAFAGTPDSPGHDANYADDSKTVSLTLEDMCPSVATPQPVTVQAFDASAASLGFRTFMLAPDGTGCPPPVRTCDSTVTSEIVFSDPTFGDIIEEHTVAFENCDVNIVRTTLTYTDGSVLDLFEQKGRSSSELLFSLCTFGASAGVFTDIEPDGYLTFIASEAPGGPALPGGTVIVRSQATVADCAIAVDPFLVP